MNTGSPLMAPNGFMGLKSDLIYHYLHSSAHGGKVKLVIFVDDKYEIKSHVLNISRSDFESALENGDIVELKKEVCPHWLEGVWGKEIAQLEKKRKSAKSSLTDIMDSRYLAISELVDNWREIIASENPNAIINAHADKSEPQQNQTRLRLWFYAYLIFGRSKLALLPRLHRIGKWSRESLPGSKKLGRKSKEDPNGGFRITPKIKLKILDGYIKVRKPGMTWSFLYGEVMSKEFGCVSIEQKDRKSKFINPDGNPFPSFLQFKYWLKKQAESRAIALELLGSKRVRAKSGHVGSFSDNLINVSQKVEFDGYYTSDNPSGVLENSPQDSICVVRAVCGLSGMILGIGFSEAKESMAAYRMSLFSMAIDKVRFCKLFGLEIDESEWPCVGLAESIVFDRGPGSSLNVTDHASWLIGLELTPSGSGQAKAGVESSHPRDKHNVEEPGFTHSAHNFVKMSKREVLRVVMDNKSSNASARMTEEMIYARFQPTPLNIWKFMDDRGRNSAVSMPFNEAVRKFLEPKAATIKSHGVYMYGRKYTAPELVSLGAYDHAALYGEVEVKAYVLTMCVRHIWIEYKGDLVELSAVIRQADAPGAAEISIFELEEQYRHRLDGVNSLNNSIPAIQQGIRDRFKQATGGDWSTGKRISGKRAKDSDVRRDANDQAFFLGKKQ